MKVMKSHERRHFCEFHEDTDGGVENFTDLAKHNKEMFGAFSRNPPTVSGVT